MGHLAVMTLLGLIIWQYCQTIESLNYCMEKPSDISTELTGRWINRPYEHRDHFARDHNMTEWWHNACPAQMIIFSCYRRDRSLLAGTITSGHHAEQSRFQPDNCQLREFTPYSFLRLIRNRRISFCCDSTAMQFFTNIVCSLHSTTTAEYHLKWFNLSSIFGTKACKGEDGYHCHLDSSHVYYPEVNATISYLGTHMYYINGKTHGDHSIKDYLEISGLSSSRDILLMNIGVHFNNETRLDGLISNLAGEYTEMKTWQNFTDYPKIIWRESSPQHFATDESGYYDTSATGRCRSHLNHTQAKSSDYRNRLIDKHLVPLGMPVLRIYNSTSSEWASHVGLQRRSDEKARYDCTHFCQPSSVFFHWRELLHNSLHALELPSP